MLMALIAIGLFFFGWFIGDSAGKQVGYREGYMDRERGEPFNPQKLDRFKF